MENKNMKLENTVTEESDSTATGTTQENAKAKAKFTFKKLIAPAKKQKMKIAIIAWFKLLPLRLIKGVVAGFIIGLIFNVIDNYFWSDLSEAIPTIFGFFNGFVTFMEFIYKVAFGFIASIFNGNFLEFNKSVWAEFVEMLVALWNWMSSISF